MQTTSARLGRAAAGLALLVGALTACTAAEEQQAVESEGPDLALTFSDGRVAPTDSGDVEVYGTLENATPNPVVIAGAETDASNGVEMIETNESASGELIAEPTGSFIVPANDSLTLAPEASYFMLRDIQQPIAAGDEVTITLTTDEGRTVDVVATATSGDAG